MKACQAEGAWLSNPQNHSSWCFWQELECSLRKSNPTLELVVLTSPGDLSSTSLQYINKAANVFHVSAARLSPKYYKEDGR